MIFNRPQNSVRWLIHGLAFIGLICSSMDLRLASADEPAKANEATKSNPTTKADEPAKLGERVSTKSVLEQQALIPDLKWSEADSGNKWNIITLVGDHMRANFDKIRTWRGTYHIRSIEPQRQDFLRSAFAGRVNGRDLSDVTLEREFQLEFAFDAQTRNIFRAKTSDLMYWRDRKKDEQFNISQTAPADERSYVSGEEYVHFDPTAKWPEFTYLMGNPDAMNKRAAFRTSSESATRRHYGDMVDPIVFFGHDQDSRLWETFSILLSAHEGKLDAAQQKKAEEAVKCFQADGPQGKFYRIDFTVKPTSKNLGDAIIYTSWIFDGAQGFHPMSFFMRRGDNEKHIRLMKWRWKRVSDVYVPEVILDVFAETMANGMNLWRECELTSTSVNEPLDPDQFTLKGLGLKEGELIVDDIKRSVDMLRDGQAVLVGKFGEQYVAPQGTPPPPPTLFSTRYIILGINIVAIVFVLVLLARRRKRSFAATK